MGLYFTVVQCSRERIVRVRDKTKEIMFYMSLSPAGERPNATKKGRKRLRWGIWGCALFVSILFMLCLKGVGSWVMAGVVCVLVSIPWGWYRVSYFARSTEEALSFRTPSGIRRVRSFLWNDIQHITLGLTEIRLQQVRGKPRRVWMGWLSYADWKTLKGQVTFECYLHAIPFREVYPYLFTEVMD